MLGGLPPTGSVVMGALPTPPKKVVLQTKTYGTITVDHAAHLARRTACRSCHGDGPVAKISFTPRQAHDTCRACHVDLKAGPTDCRGCHGAWRFSPGYLPGHDACFPIRTGHHAGIACRRCHTSIDPAMFNGTCNYNDPTLACLNCHSSCPHGDISCPITSQQCANCHRSGVGGD